MKIKQKMDGELHTCKSQASIVAHLADSLELMKRRKYHEESTKVSRVSISRLAQHPGLQNKNTETSTLSNFSVCRLFTFHSWPVAKCDNE